ncbi:hypothetical protein SAMN05443665_100259 [Actinomadura meyerae]|uniref:Uncharacterized protein n=1 Tax=Actinomadura meyerae TaxID=240840 RepID=A0A239D2B5_9ACTN|nr:hypothetical protein SAMN05443665_100259 [Actinomadura meyerae]
MDLKPRLFEHFPFNSRPDVLVKFQDATGSFPMAIIAALDKQGAAGIVQDDTRDAHRVPVALIHRSPIE